MEHAELWLKFTLAALIVVGAGMSLTKNAEKLAEVMGWGHAFAGFVILGWATSLPELTISLSAVVEVGSPDLATGNITGSVIFNLGILALLELLARHASPRGSRGDRGVLSLGSFNLVLLAALLTVMQFPELGSASTRWGIGAVLLGGYLATTAHAWFTRGSDEDATDAPEAPSDTAPTPGKGALGLRCGMAGALILAAGIWLTSLGDQMARMYALEEGLVGSLFLACVSSLPELVTGLGAMRMGLLTMAAASILGSNIFNLGILGACDLVYVQTAASDRAMVVAADGTGLLVNVIAALVMTVLAMGLVRARRTPGTEGRRRWLAAIMLVLYVGALSSHG